MEQNTQLNLARSWRSQTFDEIIGQDLSVRMLKNSLYLGQFFPVYLFSGQRGCGKTSAARVFACAVNCHELSSFQKNPKAQAVPCFACDSCKAMKAGNHPDYSEIDAASHTGVDNVRQIIESSTLLPLMGSKKVYVIDEAHMLSKAAFNAFLKILEEPPASVLFILATTDPQKIIETVRSRCFQLFFRAVDQTVLIDHLKKMCEHETIAYEEAGLQAIVQESDGSVRDAINLLEQVRFVGAVTRDTVAQVLGHVSDDIVVQLMQCVADGDQSAVSHYLTTVNFQACNPESVWKKILTFIRTVLHVQYGLKPTAFGEYSNELVSLTKTVDAERLTWWLEVMYEHELMFARTRMQHGLLEVVLLAMCEVRGSSKSGQRSGRTSSRMPEQKKTAASNSAVYKQPAAVERQRSAPAIKQPDHSSSSSEWQQFLEHVDACNDPLMSSIFKQATFERFDAQEQVLHLAFAQNVTFYREWLADAKQQWEPLLKKVFGGKASLVTDFTQQAVEQKTPERAAAVQQTKAASARTPLPPKRNAGSKKPTTEKIVDVSDQDKWQQAHTLLRSFDGTISEIEEHHEE